jgi:hypothetical protein
MIMDFNSIKKQSDTLHVELSKIRDKFNDLWLNNILFTWRWWITILLIILPWILWLFIRKKESSDRLLYAGLFIMVSSSTLDSIGVGFNLWSYPIYALPLMPNSIPYDICSLPVATMLTIQFFPKIHPFIKSVIYSATGSFVFQPIMSWIGLYNKMDWKDYYTFPVLILLYLIANYLASKDKLVKLK